MKERQTDPELEWLCNASLHALSSSFRNTRIKASYYPYVGLTHTMRKQGSTWVVRISDLCRQAPRGVLEAIVVILGCKVLRRKAPREMIKRYEHFRRHPSIETAVRQRRVLRGRKKINSAEGKHYSLTQIYCELNKTYFNNQVDIQKIGWGLRRSWVRLGHYDPVHNTVTISPVLDSPRVPRSVLDYLVYHELLHSLIGEGPHHRRHHPAEFRIAEKSFPEYGAAKKFLNEFCRTRGRKPSK